MAELLLGIWFGLLLLGVGTAILVVMAYVAYLVGRYF